MKFSNIQFSRNLFFCGLALSFASACTKHHKLNGEFTNKYDYECTDSKMLDFTESHLETNYKDVGRIGCLQRRVRLEKFSDSPTESGLPASPTLPSLLHIERYIYLNDMESMEFRCTFAFHRGPNGIVKNVEYTSHEELSTEFGELSKFTGSDQLNECTISTKKTLEDDTSSSTTEVYSIYHPETAWYSITGETPNTLRIEASLFPAIEDRVPAFEEAIELSAYIDLEELKITP